jgi:hypothetical protein
MKNFNISYGPANSEVIIENGRLSAKLSPISKKEFDYSRLTNYYLFEQDSHNTLYIAYQTEQNKTKSFQLLASKNNGGLTGLLNELSQSHHGKSLNHLSKTEALKIMKAGNPALAVAIAVFLLTTLLGVIFLITPLRHSFDSGHKELTLEEFLSNTAIETSNITIKGKPGNAVIEETTTTRRRKGGSSTLKSVFVPLLNDNGTVSVFLELNGKEPGLLDKTLSDSVFTGVIRNIGPEGMDSKNIEFFSSEYNITVTDNPILIEVTNKKRNDLWAIYLTGGFAVLGLLFGFFIYRKMK